MTDVYFGRTERFDRPFLRLTLLLIAIVSSPRPVEADIYISGFGAGGEAGSIHGREITFGTGGSVFELDAFLNIDGLDLNGSDPGSSAQMSTLQTPPNLQFGFAAELSNQNSVLRLRYSLTNRSSSIIDSIRFFSFVDAEIDAASNTYFNEFGLATGALGLSSLDIKPDSFEIDEPGYVFGDIFSNLRHGGLDNFNNVPSDFPDDVSLALGFELGSLPPNYRANVDIFLTDGEFITNDFYLRQSDSDSASVDHLTMSGTSSIVAIPEPNAFMLVTIALGLVLGLCRFRLPRQCFLVSREMGV